MGAAGQGRMTTHSHKKFESADLIGFRNRMVVFMDWAWAYFTSQRHARVFPDPHALEPNAMLVRVAPPPVPPVSVTAATPAVTPSTGSQGAPAAQPSPAR